MEKTDLLELLNYINPSTLDYQEWIDVGMALKHEGYHCYDWDAWSQRDYARYHQGECMKKWATFHGNETPVTGGTIYQMALEGGYEPDRGHELDWDAEISEDEHRIIDRNWIEGRELQEPEKWHPAQELIRYLETLFEPGENVGYVMQSWKNDKGKYIPQNKGNWDRTAGQLIEELSKCKDDIGKVLGDYNPEGGAWIRFNPLDGNGVRNENVSDFRYALVESDNMELEKQNAVLRQLELPIAVLLYSGGKSLHAIVRIDASDYQEYRKRVDYLYDICKKNGIAIDTQNRNPSRLSRMPGVTRGENKQYILDTNIGKASWSEWHEWIEGVNDSLPDIEGLSDVWDDLPELSSCLIEGVLRKGHKMLLAGPSKAGKSFLQIELAIAIAEGRKWLNWECAQGRVMYVNLELDRASCLHRFKDVYAALGWNPRHLDSIDIWNLRGKSIPMDKLAPKLIRRAQKRDYVAIIIDPIYKVITGDENSADQMAQFCNQFDRVCTELGCAVIYCHHHSKGAQGGKKSMDRASGSGVFARDPDALLDMIELDITEDIRKQQTNRAVCDVCKSFLDAHKLWEDPIPSQDAQLNSGTFLDYCRSILDKWRLENLNKQLDDARGRVNAVTAWRIEGTLREFPKVEPVDVWFKYPVHVIDRDKILQNINPEDERVSSFKKIAEIRKEQAKEDRGKILDEMIAAYEGLKDDGPVSVISIAEQLGKPEDTVKRWFGTGTKAIPAYKKVFEKYSIEDDKKVYLKRKDELRRDGN